MPMQRTLASPWFLLATALCSGLVVAFASWLAEDSSSGVRALAAVVGLGIALALMLLFARALQGDESKVATAPRVRGESAPPLRPTWAPNPTFAPTATTTAAAPSSSEAARDALTRRLDEGRALREEFDPGASDARVGAWIHGVRHTIEQHKPGVVGYFNALGARGYANDGDRLDAHIGRLTTIVRDFLPASGNVIR